MYQRFLLVLLAASTSAQSHECPDTGEHRLLPHEDCARYYQCEHRHKVVRDCAPGTHFDYQLQICNWPHLVDCHQGRTEAAQPKPTSSGPQAIPRDDRSKLPNGCPADFGIQLLLAHETECDKFYSCSNGRKYLMSCGAGTVFDVHGQICNWPYLVNCDRGTTTASSSSEAPITKTTGPPTPTGIVDKPTHQPPINDDHAPSDGVDKLQNGCPADYNIQLLVPHEYDCGSFYSCSNGLRILLSCPSGTLFDVKEQICNWPHLVNCHVTTTTSSTTSAPLTTTTTTSTVTPYTVKDTTISVAPTTSSSEAPSTNNPTSSSSQKPNTLEQTTKDSFRTTSIVEVDSSTTSIPEAITTEVPTSNTSDATATESPKTTNSDVVSTDSPTTTSTDEIHTDSPTTTSTDVINTDSPSTAEEATTIDSVSTESSNLVATTKEVESVTSGPEQPLTTVTDGITVSVPPPPICPPGTFGNVPHPELCNSFYMCAGGNAIQLFCTEGFEFDPELRSCVAISPGGCTLGSMTTWLPDASTDKSADITQSTTVRPTTEVDKDETQSTISDIGTTTIDVEIDHTTSDATESLTDKTTESPDLVATTKEVELTSSTEQSLTTVADGSTDLTTSTGAVTTDSPTTTSTDKIHTDSPTTTSTDVIHTDSPTTTSTDVTNTDIPSTAEEATTIDSVSTESSNLVSTTTVTDGTTVSVAPPPICPPGTFGNMPHPELCNSFYMCAGGNAIQLFCTEGFEFDPELRSCVAISPGGCTLGSITTWLPDASTDGSTEITQSTTVRPTTEADKDETQSTISDIGTTTIDVEIDHTTSDATESLTDKTTESPDLVTTTKEVELTTSGTEQPLTTVTDGSTDLTTSTDVIHTDSPTTTSTDAVTTDSPTTTSTDAVTTDSPTTTSTDAGITDSPTTTSTDVTNTDIPSTAEEATTIDSVSTESSDLVTTTKEVELTTESSPELTTVTDGTTVSIPPPPICPPGTFGNVPHPELCNSFYMCAGGNAIQLFCTEGFEFDPELRSCVAISPGGCTLGSITTWLPDISTTLGVSTTHSDLADTTSDHHSTTPSDGNTVIDKTTESSDLVSTPKEVELTTSSTEQSLTTVTDGTTDSTTSTGAVTTDSPTTTSTDVVTTDIPSTAEEATTIDSVSTESSDLVTTTKEVELTTESSPELTTMTDSTTVSIPPPPICPPGTFGNVPHPELCNSFYMCAGGNAIQLFCTEGFEFDPELRSCVAISPGGCTLGSITTWLPDISTTLGVSTTDSDVADTTSDHYSTTPSDGNTVTDKTTESSDLVSTTKEVELTTSGTEQSLTTVTDGTTDSTTSTGAVTTDSLTTTSTDVTHTDNPTTASTDAVTTDTPSTAEEATTIDSVSTESSDLVTTTKEVELTTSSMELTTVTDGTTVSIPPPPICPPGTFGNVPHPELCNSFYMCAGGNAIQLFCTEGFEFDPELRSCVAISPGGCTLGSITTWLPDASTDGSTESVTDTTTESSDIVSTTKEVELTTVSGPPPICSPGTIGSVPHPELCNSYYMCSGGNAIQLFCPGGFEFDPESWSCIPISPGGCTLGSITTSLPDVSTTLGVSTTSSEQAETEPTTLEGTETVTDKNTTPFVATTESLTTEIDKDITQTTINDIGTTLSDDVTEQTTSGINTESTAVASTESSDVVSTTVIELTPSIICPPGTFGNVPHPQLCNSFYMCAGGTAIQLFCTEGFEFDPVLRSCVAIAPGGCTSGLLTKRMKREARTVSEAAETITGPVSTSTICPKGTFGNVPHTTMCHSFYMCADGVKTQFYCSQGYEFDLHTKECRPISKNGCSSRK